MVFSKDNIPYTLSVGLDISTNKDIIKTNKLFDLISKCEEYKIDYIISNISINDDNTRSEIHNNFNEPIYIDDYLLFSHEWKNSFVCKIHGEDVKHLSSKYNLILQDLEYASHISCKNIIIEFSNDIFKFLKLIKFYLNKYPDRPISVIMDLTEEALYKWRIFAKAIDFNPLVSVTLRILPDLPEEVKD
jgi:hypothetical protein